MKKVISILAILALLAVGFSCSKKSDDSFSDPCGGTAPGGVVSLLVSLSQDIDMGLATKNEIESNPSKYPVMDSVQYKTAYSHIYRIRNNILNSGKVYYKNEFPWRIRLIKDDKTLNAFCTPGGFIYVYTGIIKYLDNETQLAGVMGHEIAHADRRHGAKQMIETYGISALISVLTSGTSQELAGLAANLLLLKYSRNDENEADSYSVRYLLETSYDPRGAKYFFEKISAQGGSSIPEFLSTHPSPDNRVSNIEKVWQCLGSKQVVVPAPDSLYNAFKASLP